LVHPRPQEAADEDAEEAEAAVAEATLERAAVLGRTAPAASLPLLAGLMAERRASLLQIAASGVGNVHAFSSAELARAGASVGQYDKGLRAQHDLIWSFWPTGGDPSIPLEQLWWLVRMAGALLADAGVGETPLPPVPIAAAAAAAAAADADPVARLSRELLGLLALAMDPAARPALSPRYLHHNTYGYQLWAVNML
jgi:hypothetical protein